MKIVNTGNHLVSCAALRAMKNAKRTARIMNQPLITTIVRMIGIDTYSNKVERKRRNGKRIKLSRM